MLLNNLLIAETSRKHFENIPLLKQTLYKYQALHRAQKSLDYVHVCQEEYLWPIFARIGNKNIKQIGIKAVEVRKFRKRKLNYEREKLTEKLNALKIKLEQLSKEIKSYCLNPEDHHYFLKFLKNLSFKSQIKNDKFRSIKLENLRREKKSDYNRIKVHNRTNYEIPPEVIDLLSISKNRGVGSFNDISCQNFTEMDKLFSVFQKEAQKSGINEIDIAGIKSNTVLAGISISNAKTFDPRTKILKKFLQDHEDLLILKVDKQADLLFMTKTDYNLKLKCLLDQNFTKLEGYNKNALENDLQEYRKLLTKTFTGSLPLWKIRSLFPIYSLSSFYGSPKLHKKGEPLRGLATAYDALVSNAETFLKVLLKPISEECNFSIKNNKTFKEKFLKDQKNFDHKIHRVLSADISQMYCNINVVRCVSIILDKVYGNPVKYFNFKGTDGVLLPPPKRELFKGFLLKTLQKFSIVNTPIGVYQQKTGLNMGSALSPMLSNIFVHALETKVLDKYIENNKLIHYSRFADDSLIILHKNSVRSFTKDLNYFDKSLNFTIEHMNSNNEIIFLDMTIFINNENNLEFKKYRKNSVETVISNFEHSVVSKKYLKGGIMTNLHREYDASSSHVNFLETLEELKEVFSRNSYPPALVNSKIRQFLSDSVKLPRKPMIHTVCFEYSSPVIEYSICELIRKMSQILPNFLVNVSYRSVKVSKLFSFRAKPEIDKFEKNDCVYEYLCPCEETYIGETCRTLITRIHEHQQPSSQSNICNHILSCDVYIADSNDFVSKNLHNFTSPAKAKFSNFKDKFKIIKKGFRYKKDRKIAEAYFIRVKKPSLNDQWDHKAFKVF